MKNYELRQLLRIGCLKSIPKVSMRGHHVPVRVCVRVCVFSLCIAPSPCRNPVLDALVVTVCQCPSAMPNEDVDGNWGAAP